MEEAQRAKWLDEVADGRTDRVFDLLDGGCPADEAHGGAPLIRHCAYYGDVTAVRFLLARGERLESLGENLDLNGAAFHGHWRLCSFLLERGADANRPLPETGETPLHAALCKTDRLVYDQVVQVLLAHGANPNAATIPGMETGGFMRDCRTKGETPLHRAAAFGEVETIELLLNSGAVIDARDAHGDTPLAWASWYLRPPEVVRKLCYGPYRVREGHKGMRANLLGKPHFGPRGLG